MQFSSIHSPISGEALSLHARQNTTHNVSRGAAEFIGLSQPKLSGMVRGQFRGINEVKMLGGLNRHRRNVQIVIKRSSISRVNGHTRVVFS
jgi:hypothetical protein